MTTYTTLDDKFMEKIFPNKPEEKRKAWISALQNEEYDTVESLSSASDDAWAHMPIPLAIRDQLRNAVCKKQAEPSKQSQPQPTAAAAAAATTTTTSTTVTTASFIETRPIAQIDVIVFDVSISMNSKSFEPDKTRLEAGKILFQTMVDKFVSSEFAHSLELLLFGDHISKYKFTRDCTEFENALGDAPANQGSTKLYDSILEAGRDILQFKKEHSSELQTKIEESDSECCFRIFCLTDGEDNSSVSKHWEVAKFCQENNIILDCIPLARENAILQQMAVATGGLCLRVTDTEKGVGLFERDAVLHVATREKRTTPLPVIVDSGSLSSLASQAKAVTDVKSAVPQSVAAPTMSSDGVKKAEAQASSANVKRVLSEYRAASETDVGIWYFMNANDPFFWKIIMEGPTGTPYVGCRFLLSVTFPRDYPFRPPSIRFVTPIWHCNISGDGRICLDILSHSWSPALTLHKAMMSIQSLLGDPNPDDPLDTYKAHIYRQDRTLYMEEASKHAKSEASESIDTLKAKYNIVS